MSDTLSKKLMNVEVKEINDRVISFLASPNTVDRDNELINPKGWELDNYKANPVFLWSHDRYSPSIGKAVNVYTDSKGLNIDVEFADAKTYDFADTIFKLYKGGYLKAVSVGFISKERDPANPYNILKQELLELSGVTVPANQDALAKALEDKVISKECFNGVCDIKEKDIKLENEIDLKELKKQISELKSDVDFIRSEMAKTVVDESSYTTQVESPVKGLNKIQLKELISLIENKIK